MDLFVEPLFDPQEIVDEQRYNEEELPFVRTLMLGAQALLYNADAYHPKNPMTKVLIKLIVGHWLENRESMGYDYKNTTHLPMSITALINSNRFFGSYPEDEVGDVDETS